MDNVERTPVTWQKVNMGYGTVIWKETPHRWRWEVYRTGEARLRSAEEDGSTWTRKAAVRQADKYIKRAKYRAAGRTDHLHQMQALEPPEERALQQARILYENDEDREYVIDRGSESLAAIGSRFEIPLVVKVIRVVDEDRSIARHFNRLAT